MTKKKESTVEFALLLRHYPKGEPKPYVDVYLERLDGAVRSCASFGEVFADTAAELKAWAERKGIACREENSPFEVETPTEVGLFDSLEADA